MNARTSFAYVACCAAGLLATGASAQLIAHDGFGNGPLHNLNGTSGGTGWSSNWLDQNFDTVTGVGGPGLSYTGLDTTPGAAISEVGEGVFPMSVYYRSFGPLPMGANTIYVSFLLRANPGYGMWGGLSFGTYPYEMTVGSPLGMYSFGMTLSEGLGDISNAPLIEDETNLLVVRISKNAGAGITYKLYLNPTVGQNEPSFPLAQYSVAPVNAVPTFLRIDNGGGFTTDEIRVGTTWLSVLPADLGCLGDFNNDHQVNGADLSMMLGAWGTTIGDLNNDGGTDAADLSILLGAWGPCT